MEAKSTVIKSKSSNSAMTTKSENRSNKKSRSNVEFQRNSVKKRGMYVEKKPTKISIRNKETDLELQKTVKPSPRLRPGHKQFLTSVLNILSKSTAATQHPAKAQGTENIKKRNLNKVQRKIKQNMTEKDTEKDKLVKTKGRYKSSVLNGQVTKCKNQEQLVILQPRRDTVQTPSNYSENGSYKLSDVSTIAKNDINNSKAGVIKQILHGKRMKTDKKVRIDEPVTLVENIKDKGMYNLFVDLLETTFSIYNLNAKYNAPPRVPSEVSTDAVFEIDESVAKKLDIKENDTPEMFDNLTRKPSKLFYSTAEADYNKKVVENKPKYLETRQELQLKSPRLEKRKMKAQSFIYQKKTPQLKSESAVLDKKSSLSRKSKKRTLLNMFKEELKLDAAFYKEPQNLYQALRTMARNKRKCEKAIRYERSVIKKTDTDFNDPECMFKRRKVISSSTKLSKKQLNDYKSISTNSRYSELTNSRSKYSANNDKAKSYHSIEVYGFDYEIAGNKSNAQRQEEAVLPYHSSPSLSEEELDLNAPILKYMESESFTSLDMYTDSQLLRLV